jgi:Flp pilus assembly protein TadD
MQEPSRADEQYQAGLKYFGKNKAAEAEGCFRAALTERPDWAEAANNLGVALGNRGQHPEGESEGESGDIQG